MRITSVESFILQAEIPRFVADSFNATALWGLPGVLVRTDAGLEGTGFTSTLAHGDRAITQIIDELYAPKLLGRDPLDTQALWHDLYWSDAHWIGRLGVTQMALAAVDIALWDLKAKYCNLPLWKLVGGHKPGRVPSYNTDGGWLNFDVARLIDEMQRIVGEGWRGVKMKVGKDDPREDLARVAAARAAIGDEIDLMIDVNQRWDRTRAIEWSPRFEDFEIRWLEEPMDPDDIEGHARLADVTRIPIALGEHVYSKTAFREYIQRANIAYVQADVTRLAGVTEWLAVAEMALSHHVAVVPHHADMMRVHQHLGTGHAACPMIECIPWLQELFEEPAKIDNGEFVVPTTPGASTTFNKAAFEAHRVA